MSLVEINWNPTNRQLRQFGVVCFFALPLIGWFWHTNAQVVAILAGVGVLLAGLGIVLPDALRPVFLALTLVATPIGLVISELVLLIIYLGVFCPIGFAFRLAKRDTLQMRVNRKMHTHWKPKRPPNGVTSYYRQS